MASGGLIGKLRVWIGVDNSDYKKGLNQSKQQTNTFAKQVGGTLKSIGGAFAIGAVIKKAFDFSKEAYLAAEQARGVKIAFDRLNDPALLGNLKAATKGTVDEMKLMQVAVQAKNFKIPIENLSSYLKFATQRARETGESVDYLVGSIVTGIGRKSPMILDDLGINALEVREEFKKTGDMAAAVANIIEREMAGSVEQVASKTQQFSAVWENFKSNIGEIGAIRRTGDAIYDFLVSAINSLNDSLTTTGKTPIDEWVQKNIAGVDDLGESFKNLQAQINASNETLDGWGVNSAGLSWWQRGLNNIGRGFTKLFTLGFIDRKRDEEIARNARMAAYDAHNDKVLKSNAEAKIKELNLEKKSIVELEKLQAQFSGTTSSKYGQRQQLITEAIAGEITKRSEAKIKADEDAAEAAKDAYKQTIAYAESANTKELAFLKSQEQAYGTTLVFQEKLLSVMREREGFARSDSERIALKAQNDELERKIKLRKEAGGAVLSIENLQNQIAAAETQRKRSGAGSEEFKGLTLEIERLKSLLDYIEKPRTIDINITTNYMKGIFDEVDADFGKALQSADEKAESYREHLGRIKSMNEEFASVIEGGAEAAIASLGAAIGALANGETEAVWLALLNPIADMAIQLGELAIATGVTMEGIKASFETLGGFGAIAAGIALVALGTAVKGAIGNIGKGSGSSQSPNTFTGGYSYGSNTPSYAATNAVSRSSEQTIVVKGEVSGSALKFVLDKDAMRRNS